MGNPIIDRARAHYAAHGAESLDVPEWGDEAGPLRVYWTPVTCAERQKITNRYKDGQSQEALVYVLILKACDAKGNPLFSLDDKPALMNGVDVAVVDRIASAILTAPSVDDMEKN